MSDTDDLKTFVRTLFRTGPKDNETWRDLFASHNETLRDQLAPKSGADDGIDEQRRFIAALLTPNDPDENILAGLTTGRSVSRTTADQSQPLPHNAFRYR